MGPGAQGLFERQTSKWELGENCLATGVGVSGEAGDVANLESIGWGNTNEVECQEGPGAALPPGRLIPGEEGKGNL